MDKITIINGDQGDDLVVKNGRAIAFSLTGMIDKNIWAVQWDDSKGSGIVEVKEGQDYPIENLNDFSEILAEFKRLSHIEDEPAEHMSLDELKAVKRADINSKASEKITGGFFSSALGSPMLYESDRSQQINLIDSISAGGDDLFKCEDSEGVEDYRLHSNDELKQVLTDGRDTKLGYLLRAKELKELVEAAEDRDALNLIVISFN